MIMELYNFFTKPVNKIRLDELKDCLNEVLELGANALIIEHKDYVSIIGQYFGSDTNVGDTDLLWIFAEFDYTYFNAFLPIDNNLLI